jgi:hypothetical protein
MYVIQHYFICRPSDSSESEDAGIEHIYEYISLGRTQDCWLPDALTLGLSQVSVVLVYKFST